MSIEAMTWALSVPVGGTAKVVLLGLANHADAHGREARPSVATLAEYAACDRRTVQRTLRRLEADGWIEVSGRHEVAGRPDRAVTVYRCVTGRQIAAPHGAAPVSPREASGAALVTERGGTGVASGAAPTPPEPSIEPSLNRPNDTARERAVVSPEATRVSELMESVGLPFSGPEPVERLIAEHPRVDVVAAAERCAEWAAGKSGVRHPLRALLPFVTAADAPERKKVDPALARYANVGTVDDGSGS